MSNKSYSTIVSDPNGFGKPGREIWASIWELLQPVFIQVMAGTAVYKENEQHEFMRYGDDLKLETYYSYRFVPITNKEGKVIGMFNQASETTDQILAERRLSTVRDMSEQMLLSRTRKEYYDGIAEVLEQNSKDAPFALCYSVDQRGKIETLACLGRSQPADDRWRAPRAAHDAKPVHSCQAALPLRTQCGSLVFPYPIGYLRPILWKQSGVSSV